MFSKMCSQKNSPYEFGIAMVNLFDFSMWNEEFKSPHLQYKSQPW
jgi:hypothetical protein